MIPANSSVAALMSLAALLAQQLLFIEARQFVLEAFAENCCQLRHASMSAAYCMVRAQDVVMCRPDQRVSDNTLHCILSNCFSVGGRNANTQEPRCVP